MKEPVVHTILTLSFCMLILLPASGDSHVLQEGLVTLETDWEYRWGDSSIDGSGVPVWTYEEASEAWQSISFPSNPPGREGRTNVWYRVPLPRTEIRDPAVFIHSMDLIGEIYLDGVKIYGFGEFDDAGKGSFQGWPWHLFRLPEDFAGKKLYFRIYSDYRDIGLWGHVLLGSGSDQTRRIFTRDIVRIVVAIASLLITLIFLTIFFAAGRDRSAIFLALITFFLLLRVLSLTYIKQYLMDTPLLWEYVRAAAHFMVLVFIVLLLERILPSRYRWISRGVLIGVLGFFIAAVGGSLTGLFTLAGTYIFFDVLAVVIIGILGFLSVKSSIRGDMEGKLLTGNFVVMGLLTIYGMLVYNSLVPWSDDITYLTVFQFTLGLSFILIRRFLLFHRRLQMTTGELETLNATLEKRVTERTYQLEQANRKLRQEKISLHITSITDDLTGIYNRRYITDRYRTAISEASRYGRKLSIFMLDIDHFKKINDSFGHQVGDVVLRKLAGVFEDALRDSDLVGRYGGEEFLVILPEAESGDALYVAERIRSQVESLSWEEPGLSVTVSGGVAELDGEDLGELLEKADTNLYKAKRQGRNRIVT